MFKQFAKLNNGTIETLVNRGGSINGYIIGKDAPDELYHDQGLYGVIREEQVLVEYESFGDEVLTVDEESKTVTITRQILSLSDEEIVVKENAKQIKEATQYLNDTGWIWEKYQRNVVVLQNMTHEEFTTKYADIISAQEAYRELINTLELSML